MTRPARTLVIIPARGLPKTGVAAAKVSVQMHYATREFFEVVIRQSGPGPAGYNSFRPRGHQEVAEPASRPRMQDGVHPSLHIKYMHFDLKQYFKEGRVLRRQTTST